MQSTLLSSPDAAPPSRHLTAVSPATPTAPRWAAPTLIAAVDALGLVTALILAGTGAAAWVYAALAALALATTRSYRPRISLNLSEEVLTVFGRLGAAVLVVAPFAGAGAARLPIQGAVTGVAVVLGRVASYRLIRAARRGGTLYEPTVIVGSGQVATELGQILEAHPELGLAPVGFLAEPGTHGPGRRLGTVDALEDVVRERNLRRVIVAFSREGEHDLIGLMRCALRDGVAVHVVPRFFDLRALPISPGVDDVWGIPLYQLRATALQAPGWRAKRVFDVVTAGAALVVVAPVLAVAAVAVRLTSRGPVLFRQRRVGQFGREFACIKFRTMEVNDDADVTWSVATDERLTPVGRLLRRTSVDELPQLWNVLRGDMSLVGPRPERPYFVEQFATDIAGYDDRHRVPVGLTGWAQVHGLRGDTSIAERARFDNNYIEQWSPWRDAVILFRTASEVARAWRRQPSMATMAALGDDAEPWNAASPNANTSPSAATIR
jgi:exopolysaccharide biosynthesis polyprenyl glycosylphosphotransferase